MDKNGSQSGRSSVERRSLRRKKSSVTNRPVLSPSNSLDSNEVKYLNHDFFAPSEKLFLFAQPDYLVRRSVK